MIKHTLELKNMINNEVEDHITDLLKSESNQSQILQVIDNLSTLGFSFHLNDKNQLELYSAELNQSITVDFTASDIKNKIDPQKAKPAIIKAIEGRTNQTLKVLDGTAGLGSESFVIAARGHTVTSIEKSEVIYTLLLDGLNRAKSTEAIQKYGNNISLNFFDTVHFLVHTTEMFDVIYLDPMFPERKKSAKVKKGMQTLQLLLGHSNLDEKKLFDLAINHSKKLVIKRAINNPYFADKKPTNSLKGKSNRFDIYV